MNEDGRLVARAKAGDREAFSALVKVHQAWVHGLCLKLVGNQPDADALAHDAFVEAYLKLAQLKEPDRFGGWLRVLALNLCRMALRGRRNEPLTDLLVPATKPSEPSRLVGCWSNLSEAHRLVLALHYSEGLSVEEVAAFLDVPTGTVMSRLYRARRELRQQVERGPAGDDEMKQADDAFGREVDAEINALVAIARNDGSATERLRVILQRSPDRFAQLVTEAGDDRALEDLALLLHRLEGTGVEGVLACCFSTDGQANQQGRALLARFLQAQRPWAKGYHAYLIERGVYTLLDRLTASPVDPAVKAELLVGFLDLKVDEQVARLVVNTLLCYPEEAFRALLARFWAAGSAKALNRAPDVLQALTRFGARFAAELVQPLQGGVARVRALAMGGAEAFARCYALPPGSDLEPRILRNWCPLRASSVQPEVVQALADAVAGVATDKDADLQRQAVRILGLLRSDAHFGLLAKLAAEEGDGVARFAIRAIAEMGDSKGAALLNDLAREGRPAAVEALARVPGDETQATLVALMRSEDPELRKLALGSLGSAAGDAFSPDALDALEDATHWPDKALAYEAVKLLKVASGYRKPTAEQVARRKRIAAFLGRPETPAGAISLELALRALPSNKPCSEMSFTKAVASVCSDFASTRRFLVEEGLVNRDRGVCRLTEAGETAWRVERFIATHYLV